MEKWYDKDLPDRPQGQLTTMTSKRRAFPPHRRIQVRAIGKNGMWMNSDCRSGSEVRDDVAFIRSMNPRRQSRPRDP